MITVFGSKSNKATRTELKMLDMVKREHRFFDIDTKEGKAELSRRGLFFKEVKKYMPWVINE